MSLTRVQQQMMSIANYASLNLGYALINGYLKVSTTGATMKIEIKTKAGNDPSALDPVYVLFRNATLVTGDYTPVAITAANTVIIPNGATMGIASNLPNRIWVVAFNTGGAVELGVVNCLTGGLTGLGIRQLIDHGTDSANLIDASADIGQVIYSPNGVTSKPMRILGYFEPVSVVTPGTWTSDPTTVQMVTRDTKLPGEVVQTVRSFFGAFVAGTTVIPNDDTIPQITEGNEYMTNTIKFSSPFNMFVVDAKAHAAISAGTAAIGALFQDASANALAAAVVNAATVGIANPIGVKYMQLCLSVITTTFRFRAGVVTAGTMTFNGQAGARTMGGVMNSYMETVEYMT